MRLPCIVAFYKAGRPLTGRRKEKVGDFPKRCPTAHGPSVPFQDMRIVDRLGTCPHRAASSGNQQLATLASYDCGAAPTNPRKSRTDRDYRKVGWHPSIFLPPTPWEPSNFKNSLKSSGSDGMAIRNPAQTFEGLQSLLDRAGQPVLERVVGIGQACDGKLRTVKPGFVNGLFRWHGHGSSLPPLVIRLLMPAWDRWKRYVTSVKSCSRAVAAMRPSAVASINPLRLASIVALPHRSAISLVTRR